MISSLRDGSFLAIPNVDRPQPLTQTCGGRARTWRLLGYFLSWLPGASSYGAPVPEEPRNNLRPSGNVRSLPLARCDPSLAWYPSTTTSVPGSRDSLVNPRRNRTFGLPASMAQFSTVPSAFFTSTCNQVWGFTHSIFVIVPLKLTGLFASNSAAKTWCAHTDVARPHITRPTTQSTVASFARIDFSLLPRVNQDGRRGPRRLDIPVRDIWRPSMSFTAVSAVPIIEFVAGRHFARNVDRYGVALPVLHQLFLAQTSIHELLDEFVAAKLE